VVSDIKKAALQGDGGRDVRSDFVLLRREIRNGIITADVLEALRRVATNAEWAAIRRLQLVTACRLPESVLGRRKSRGLRRRRPFLRGYYALRLIRPESRASISPQGAKKDRFH
jgi:hypothetical protein